MPPVVSRSPGLRGPGTGSLQVGARAVECEMAGEWRVGARGSAEPLLKLGLCSVRGGVGCRQRLPGFSLVDVEVGGGGLP